MHSTRRLPLIYGRNAQKRVMAKLASNPVRVPFALTEEKCAKHLFASMGHFPCEPSNTTFCTDYVGRLSQRAGSRGSPDVFRGYCDENRPHSKRHVRIALQRVQSYVTGTINHFRPRPTPS